MRLLFVCAEPPWPSRGGASIRAVHLLRGLALEHEVHVVCCGTARATVACSEALAGTCAAVHAVLPPPPRSLGERLAGLVASDTPDLCLRYQDDRLVGLLTATLADTRFDAVHVTGLEMLPPVLTAARALPRRARPRVVLDAQNAEYLLQARAADVARGPAALYSRVQAWKLRCYEGALGRQLSGVLAVSSGDLAALRSAGLRVPAAVVPNGVETARYTPDAKPDRQSPTGGSPRLLFAGTMDYRPNEDAAVWFVESMWPAVRRSCPAAALQIAGRRPSRAVRALAGDGVEVTGEIDDDLPLFRAADLFVLPMRFGGGTRLKLLQALACGLPVVSTAAGAEGVELAHGREVLLANDAVGFASAVVHLACSPATATALGHAARAAALRHDWSIIVPVLLDFYRRWERPAGPPP